MSTLDDLVSLLEKTDNMKQVLKTLKEEPVYLLGEICREYKNVRVPVPDHRLNFAGFMGEAALKTLVAAGLIKRQPGGRLSVYCYEPTQEGLDYYERLLVEGFYKAD